MEQSENLKGKIVEIPKIFKTSVSEVNFTNCISCEKDLLENNEEYFIEKIINNNQVEIEYAMCMDCIEEMRKSFSEESMQKIEEYFAKNLDVFTARYNIMVNGSTNVNDYISHCIFNNKSIENLNEYQLIAHCKGNKLLLSVFPYMVSHDVIEEVQGLLSAKTKEELDRFTDKHFGLPPDLLEIVKNKKIVII